MDLLLWTMLDDIDVPYIYRAGERYIAVRMIETRLLSRYPRSFMKSVQYKPALASHYMSQDEANIFNACSEDKLFRLGLSDEKGRYTKKDLVILLDEFEKFYKVLKQKLYELNGSVFQTKAELTKTCSPIDKVGCSGNFDNSKQYQIDQQLLNERHSTIATQLKELLTKRESNVPFHINFNNISVLPCHGSNTNSSELRQNVQTRDVLENVKCFQIQPKCIPPATQSHVRGGWLQVNNTVVPFVFRNAERFLPISVLKNAAGIQLENRKQKLHASISELYRLNKLCEQSTLNFEFPKRTKLVSMRVVKNSCIDIKVLKLLPTRGNALENGEYMDLSIEVSNYTVNEEDKPSHEYKRTSERDRSKNTATISPLKQVKYRLNISVK